MKTIWKVKDLDQEFSDHELIHNIKNGNIKPDAQIYNSNLDRYVYLKDTVYSFYLEKEEDYEKKN